MNVLRIIFYILVTGLFIGSLFIECSWFVNESVTPKWYFTIFIVLILIIFIVFSYNKLGLVSNNDIRVFFALAASACSLQAIYGILKYYILQSGYEKFLSGSFENPAGFAASLCAGFPFLLYFILDQNRIIKSVSYILITLIFSSVLLSQSRAGIISLLIISSILFYYKLPMKVKKRMAIITLVLCFSFTTLYFYKKDSADGRLLIWNCSINMIKDKPITGFGFGGFKANYMNYQAEYFKNKPDSRYLMIADNVSMPFNEYLLVLVNYGTIGFLLLMAFIVFLWKTFLKSRNNSYSFISLLCLISIAVFSFFSYPLRYSFVWIVGIQSIILILRNNNFSFLTMRSSVALKFIVMGFVLTMIFFVYKNMKKELNWNRIAQLSLKGKFEEVLPEYSNLHKKLRNNELFLYNYAAELYLSNYFNKSLIISQECNLKLADYDLQILIADNYLQLRKYEEAEFNYIKAANMCPVKFMPLYKLFEIYRMTGQNDKAEILAKKIVDKGVKIPSAGIYEIKKEMTQYLEQQKYAE